MRKVIIDILNATHDHVVAAAKIATTKHEHVIVSCVQYINNDFSHEHLFPLSTTDSPPL
ncbi:hypothetical protein M404DRAFT_34319 [Pisolithus tinctorius Marx 270]|uniref:Uncharacterized protein n=1 Tax=Pisolithus tinctorius Marx 270 TaxID=870435 RepID=A0A0C3NIF2_PISTI|nr:hypothetical protein M404DRAFT_34319 [Pisolithus tinctorius Marx 270]